MLKKCFDDLGFTTYGGTDAPYVWVSMDGKPSWDSFAEILEKTDIVTTPGAGFGIAGEGFIRVRTIAASSFDCCPQRTICRSQP